MSEVEAVKEPDKIKLISYLLKRHFSQQLADIWEVGLNLALRISDLLGTFYGHQRRPAGDQGAENRQDRQHPTERQNAQHH